MKSYELNVCNSKNENQMLKEQISKPQFEQPNKSSMGELQIKYLQLQNENDELVKKLAKIQGKYIELVSHD